MDCIQLQLDKLSFSHSQDHGKSAVAENLLMSVEVEIAHRSCTTENKVRFWFEACIHWIELTCSFVPAYWYEWCWPWPFLLHCLQIACRCRSCLEPARLLYVHCIQSGQSAPTFDMYLCVIQMWPTSNSSILTLHNTWVQQVFCENGISREFKDLTICRYTWAVCTGSNAILAHFDELPCVRCTKQCPSVNAKKRL